MSAIMEPTKPKQSGIKKRSPISDASSDGAGGGDAMVVTTCASSRLTPVREQAVVLNCIHVTVEGENNTHSVELIFWHGSANGVLHRDLHHIDNLPLPVF
jgi:hypothetical protein